MVYYSWTRINIRLSKKAEVMDICNIVTSTAVRLLKKQRINSLFASNIRCILHGGDTVVCLIVKSVLGDHLSCKDVTTRQ